jgi:hypothetical protein
LYKNWHWVAHALCNHRGRVYIVTGES